MVDYLNYSITFVPPNIRRRCVLNFNLLENAVTTLDIIGNDTFPQLCTAIVDILRATNQQSMNTLENLSTKPIMSLDHIPEEQRYNKNNIVAKWCAPINGKMYRIELEHGTTSGRRMIWVNGKEVLRRDWMFKLVGEDTFYIDEARCIIRVDPAPGFKYEYLLFIDGKSHEQYTEEQTKQYRLWVTTINGVQYRIMLELDTLNLYINDELRAETAEFVDGGTDTTVHVDDVDFILQTRSSGNKLSGIVHTLLANQVEIPEAKIQEIMQEPCSILST